MYVPSEDFLWQPVAICSAGFWMICSSVMFKSAILGTYTGPPALMKDYIGDLMVMIIVSLCCFKFDQERALRILSFSVALSVMDWMWHEKKIRVIGVTL